MAKGVFDTYLELAGSYQMDKAKRTTPIFGSRQDIWNWNASFSKQLPTGTTLGLSFDNVRSTTFGSNINGNQIIPSMPLYEPVLGISLGQSFMQNAFGLASRASVDEARLAYEAADAAYKRQVDVTVSKGLGNFWTLVFVRKNIEVQEKAVNFAKQFLNTTLDEKRLGTAEETDVLAAKANYLKRQDELMVLRERELTAMDLLRHDLEYGPDDELDVFLDEPPFADCGVFSDERVALALERRGDYQAIKNELERLNVVLKVAKNTRWPSLDLVSSLELNDVDPSYKKAVGNMDSPNVTVGLSFSVPLENRRARADASRARADVARSLYAMKDLENQIVNSLSRLILEVQSRKKIVETNRQVFDLQVRKLLEEMKKYRMGRSSSYIVVQYQNDAVSAEKGFIDAWLAYQASVLGLDLAESRVIEGK
jgi:outer membrane protein TolC